MGKGYPIKAHGNGDGNGDDFRRIGNVTKYMVPKNSHCCAVRFQVQMNRYSQINSE